MSDLDGVGSLEYFWHTVGKSFFIMLFIGCSIIFLVLFIVTFGFKSERFNSWCENNGGNLDEIANVTCHIKYPNCWRLCNFECGIIGYYDDWEIPECEEKLK